VTTLNHYTMYYLTTTSKQCRLTVLKVLSGDSWGPQDSSQSLQNPFKDSQGQNYIEGKGGLNMIKEHYIIYENVIMKPIYRG
jgi:hypothetical protein